MQSHRVFNVLIVGQISTCSLGARRFSLRVQRAPGTSKARRRARTFRGRRGRRGGGSPRTVRRRDLRVPGTHRRQQLLLRLPQMVRSDPGRTVHASGRQCSTACLCVSSLTSNCTCCYVLAWIADEEWKCADDIVVGRQSIVHTVANKRN